MDSAIAAQHEAKLQEVYIECLSLLSGDKEADVTIPEINAITHIIKRIPHMTNDPRLKTLKEVIGLLAVSEEDRILQAANLESFATIADLNKYNQTIRTQKRKAKKNCRAK